MDTVVSSTNGVHVGKDGRPKPTAESEEVERVQTTGERR